MSLTYNNFTNQCYIDKLLNESDNYIVLLILTELMMTSSKGNIFRVTGHVCGEFTGPRRIPRTKASDAELWYFRWSAPE